MKIALLGGATITRENGSTDLLRQSRAAGLLGCLVLREGRAATRDELAELLWPERDPEAARHNLRQALVHLRDAIACEESLEANRTTIRLAQHRYASDVQEFRSLLTRRNEEASLREAIQLYGGSFLPGIDDEWALNARAELSGLYLNALLDLGGLVATRDPAEALALAEKAVAEDPLHDGARAAKIRALMAAGDKSGARREYKTYEAKLFRELGMLPSQMVRDAVDSSPSQTKFQEDARPASAEFRAALDSLAEGPYPVEALQLAISLVPYWKLLGTPGEGIDRLTQAALQSGPEPSRLLKAEAIVCIAELAFLKQDYPQAKDVALEALAVLRESPAGSLLVRALRVLGRTLTIFEDYRGARQTALEALRISRSIGEIRGTLEVTILLATIHQYRHDLRRSLRMGRKAASLARSQGDLKMRIKALSLIAFAGQHSGDIQATKAALIEVDILLDEAPDNRDTAFARAAFARMAELRGQKAGCRDAYIQGIQMAREYRDAWLLGVALTYLGEFEIASGNPVAAIEPLKEALALRLTRTERLGAATTLRGLGWAYLELEDPGKARGFLRESATLYREVQDIPGLGTAIYFLAKAEQAGGDIERARRLAQMAARTLRMAPREGCAATIADGGSFLDRAIQLLRQLA